MRYSGLRISDSISLRRDAVVDGKIRLRTEKTNTDVYVPVPPKIVAALEALPDQGERFFWNGKGKLKTRVANWSRYLDTVFTVANVEGAHSHRFRHAFSVSLLQKGVSVENVATLLGNSPKVVMKHYSPWIAERQSLLEAAVMKTW
jgi:integrase